MATSLMEDLLDEQIDEAMEQLEELITAPVREITSCQRTQRKRII